jgi:molybdenum cofactor cytidylyltransferase
MSTIGLIILAAGASIRMGTPKQLLLYRKTTLLRHTVNIALCSICHPVIVVLGAYFEQIKPEVEQLPIYIVENIDWEKGMGTSIRAGVLALNQINQNAQGVVITVCDQPFLSVDVIARLLDAYALTHQPIIASEYADTFGVPALFDRVLFAELTSLKASQGAKQVFRKHHQEVSRVCFPDGAIDLDTRQDYEQIKQSHFL